jgi:hypothetical protein
MMNLARHLAGAAAILAVFGVRATALRADEFRLESATLPAPLIVDGKTDTVIEASGVEPIGDGRRVLVAHDKLPGLYVVETATGRVLGPPIASAKFPAASKIGPKWEGMALDPEGNYYLIGAHVGKTDEERTAKSFLFRFRLKDGASGLPVIDEATLVRWHIERSLVAVLKAAGLDETAVAKRKIEGLAFRPVKAADGSARRTLVIGLREPGDKVRAFAADITDASPDAELELAPAFTFEADPREGTESQLTSLEHVPALAGMLVLTASEDAANAFHGNTLWFVADGQTRGAVKVATFEVAMKAEGLAVLGVEQAAGRTAVKLLVTYDNDPHATKIPSRFQTVTLVRETR